MIYRIDPDDPRFGEYEKKYGGREKVKYNPFLMLKIVINITKEDVPSFDYLCNHFPVTMSVSLTIVLTPVILYLYLLIAKDIVEDWFKK